MATVASLLVKLGLDGKRFDKGLKKALRGMEQLARKAEGLSKLSKLAGLATLGASAMALTAALGPASAALLALPAAAAVAGAALATLSVGLAGMGEAMEAVASGDAAALEKALKGLAPSAQEFVRSWAGIRESFAPVQQAVQQRLFAGLGEELSSLATGVMPTLERGMTDVADSMNGLATEAMAAMNTPLFKGALADTFDGTAAATESFGGLLGPLATLLLQLSAAGLPLVTRFTEWATGATEAASAFLGTEAGAARLSEIVTTAGDIMSQLGTIIGNLAMGLGSMFGAASGDGQSLLDTITQLTERFRAWAASAEGQQTMGQVFDVLSQAGEQILTTMPQILGVLGTLLSMFQSLPGPVQENAAAILAWAVIMGPAVSKVSSLVGAVKGIAPAVKMLTGPLGKLGKVLGKLGVKALIMGAKMLAGWIMGMGPIGWIIAAVIALVALIIIYWDEIVAAITAAWEWIKTATVAAWTAIKEWFIGLVTSIVTWVTAKFNQFMTGLKAIWTLIKVGTMVAWNAIKEFLIGLVVGVVTWVNAKIAMFVARVKLAWELIKLGTKIAWEKIKSTVLGLVEAVVTWVTDKVQALKDKVVGAWNRLKSMTVTAWNRLKSAVVGKIAELMSSVREIPGKIKSAVGNLGSLLLNAGRDIIQGLIDGVQGMVGSLRNKFSEITGMIPDWKGPMSVDLKLLEPAGEGIMTGLNRGIEKSLPGLRSTLGDVTKAIPANVSTSVRHTGGREDRLVLDVTGTNEDWKKLMRKMVRTEGRGDVQLAFGSR